MKQSKLFRAAALLAVTGACSLSPRQQCYADNYCSTADADCIMGWTILSSLMSTSSSSSSSSSSTSSSSGLLGLPSSFWMLMCVGSKEACEADCNQKHAF